MSKKIFTRVVASVCTAAILSATLTSCNSKAPSEAPSVPQSSGTASLSKNPNFNAEGLPILKEKQTFKIAVAQTSPIKAAELRDAVIETEEATNIHIEWIEIPNSAWKEKINIMFSTDTLPDAIIGDLDISKNYNQLAMLDDYLDAYAPNVTSFISAREDYAKSLKAPDGKIHTLPGGDESVHNLIDSTCWINTEWLKNAGLEMPTTTEEFKNALIAFRDTDPNGNKQKDEIPFTFEKAWGFANMIENMFGSFGVVENDEHVFTKDNKVVFSAMEQGYYDALSWFNSLYKENLIDKEVFTISSEQYASRSAGKDILGAFVGYGPTNAGVKNNEALDRYQALPLLKGPTGIQMTGLNNATKTGGFAISAKCENPEALVRWYDHINSSLESALKWGRGAKDVYWQIEEKDGKEIPVFLFMDSAQLEKLGYKTMGEYRNAESLGGKTPALWKLEYDKNIVKGKGWPAVDFKLQSVLDAMPLGVTGLPAGTADSANSQRRAILKVDIDNYLEKFVADSIINGIDEKKWSKHQETLKALKAEEYRALCQEYVDGLGK